jgi:ATP-dependent Lhr-like helicase
VDRSVLGRFTVTWQGVARKRAGADALLDAIDHLQGAPLPASILETEILPARIEGYDPADLDAVTAAGEVVWVGVEPLGERDGRIALYLADQAPLLLPPTMTGRPGSSDPARGGSERTRSTDRETSILDFLRANGASFFGPLHEAAGGGYPAETVDTLWQLTWRGFVTNDTFHALRAFTRAHAPRRRAKPRRSDTVFRSRRLIPPSAEGRWGVTPASVEGRASHATRWAAAVTQQLLARHGVLTREAVLSEAVPGGFGTVYPVLKGLEENGRVRRGYFVAGLGATQFAQPGALDLLRSLRETADVVHVSVLAATDPANPYGATLRWPARKQPRSAQSSQTEPGTGAAVSAISAAASIDAGRAPTRSVGATVILVNGALAAYLARGDRQLAAFLPADEPERSKTARAVAQALIERARSALPGEPESEGPRGMLIEEIDGVPPELHALSRYLVEAGFVGGARGLAPSLRI